MVNRCYHMRLNGFYIPGWMMVLWAIREGISLRAICKETTFSYISVCRNIKTLHEGGLIIIIWKHKTKRISLTGRGREMQDITYMLRSHLQ
jgi:hypothetical protein